MPGDEPSNALDEYDYHADESAGISRDDFALRSTNWDIEDQDNVKRAKLNADGEINVDDGMYRGQSGYLKTITKSDGTRSDAKMKTGPIRATAHIRSITLMDYQPDVCKPYKETGFCGYGDSCKFMHDRGDYLAGWQLDQLDPSDGQVAEVVEEEEMLPFACLICKQEFTEPVVTKCGHYFCMKCAVDRFIKSPKCYACGAATNGIFNKAEKLLAKLESKRKRRMEEKGLVDEDDEDDGGIEIGGNPDSDDENAGDSDTESRGEEQEG
jgi:RING finger protein 113A